MIKPIQITPAIADDITAALQATEHDAERHRPDARRQIEHRHRAVIAKLDRGYDDYVEGRISHEFWDRKSKAWEAELQVIDSERARLQQPRPEMAVTAEKILELAKQAENLYKSPGSGRAAPIAGNGAIELHVRSRKSLCHLR